MFDPRRYIGLGAVLALVMLRLVTGWHFFSSGMEKIEVDPHTKRARMTFTAAPFLSQAKGPFADFFHSQAATGHDWQLLLAVGREARIASPDEVKERDAWASADRRRRAEADKNNVPAPAEIPPFEDYHDWGARTIADWRLILERVKSIASLTEEQKQAADVAFARRTQELAEYLASQGEDIAEYQHQLWRLENWRSGADAEVPFEEKRIDAKATETSATPRPWVAQVAQLDQAYLNDLSSLLSSEQRTHQATVAAMEEAQILPQQKWLNNVNLFVTVLTITVGICLLIGFFTRLAALAGAVFLMSVIATQPPWLPDASPIAIYQVVEAAALLVLAGTKAGRWLGLDFLTYALFSRHRGPETTS